MAESKEMTFHFDAVVAHKCGVKEDFFDSQGMKKFTAPRVEEVARQHSTLGASTRHTAQGTNKGELTRLSHVHLPALHECLRYQPPEL